jgi:hypothetical protein
VNFDNLQLSKARYCPEYSVRVCILTRACRRVSVRDRFIFFNDYELTGGKNLQAFYMIISQDNEPCMHDQVLHMFLDAELAIAAHTGGQFYAQESQ